MTKKQPLPNRIALMLAGLATKPMTNAEIAELTGMSRPTVQRWVRMMHACQAIHIGEWRSIVHSKGHSKYSGMYPAYSLGRSRDVARPTKLTKD
jgi:hypothetical protein